MCYGFIGKTFHLQSQAKNTPFLKQKFLENKRFHRETLPGFRDRQVRLALEGRGMYVKHGLEIDARKTMLHANSRRSSRISSSNNNNYNNNNTPYLKGSSSSSSSTTGNLLRSSSSSSSSMKNPQLTMNRPEVKMALRDARRALALTGETKSFRKR